MSAAPPPCTYFVRRRPFPLLHKSLLFLWGFVGEQMSPMASQVNKLPAACRKSIVFNRLLLASCLSPTLFLKFDVRRTRFITLSVSRNKKGGQGKREEEDRGLALESDQGLPNFSHIPRVFSNRIRREPPTTFHSVTDIIMRVKIVRTVNMLKSALALQVSSVQTEVCKGRINMGT